MVYFVILFTLSVLWCPAIRAQPKLLMQKSHNWGKVVPTSPTDQKVRVRIPVRNIGNQLLRITEVRPSCGCTSAPLEKDSLLPGEETALNITLTLPNMNGVLSTKHVTVITNEPDSNKHELALNLDVERPIQISSPYIPFNAGSVGDTIVGEIGLICHAAFPVTITRVEVPEQFSVTSKLPVTLTQDQSYTLSLAYKATTKGPITKDVTVFTDLPGFDKIVLTTVGVVLEKK